MRESRMEGGLQRVRFIAHEIVSRAVTKRQNYHSVEVGEAKVSVRQKFWVAGTRCT